MIKFLAAPSPTAYLNGIHGTSGPRVERGVIFVVLSLARLPRSARFRAVSGAGANPGIVVTGQWWALHRGGVFSRFEGIERKSQEAIMDLLSRGSAAEISHEQGHRKWHLKDARGNILAFPGPRSARRAFYRVVGALHYVFRKVLAIRGSTGPRPNGYSIGGGILFYASSALLSPRGAD